MIAINGIKHPRKDLETIMRPSKHRFSKTDSLFNLGNKLLSKMIYTYEAKNGLYDVHVVEGTVKYYCLDCLEIEPLSIHKEIEKHFNI